MNTCGMVSLRSSCERLNWSLRNWAVTALAGDCNLCFDIAKRRTLERRGIPGHINNKWKVPVPSMVAVISVGGSIVGIVHVGGGGGNRFGIGGSGVVM